MVWQIKKIVCIFCLAVVLITATCGTVQAATHTIYENGNLSNTYVTYFKDIISGAKLTDNYVAFRSGQYSYTMVVGDIKFNNNSFTCNDTCIEYVFSTESSNYNSQYRYYVNELNNFSLNTSNDIIYSDLGHFPQLLERGAKYEILTTILLCIFGVCIIVARILPKR